MFEGGIKVPAFAVWKGRILPGSQTENMALLMDLFPSFCKIAGADLNHEVNGLDVSPTMLGKQQNTDDRQQVGNGNIPRGRRFLVIFRMGNH